MSAATLPRPRTIVTVDLVVPVPGADGAVAELTCYGQDGCPRSVLHLPVHPDRTHQLAIAARAAAVTWGVSLGAVVQELELGSQTLLRFAPTAL